MSSGKVDLQIADIQAAYTRQKECKDLNFHTKCEKNIKMSEKYKSNIYFKREDQQQVRIFKMRGIYNKMLNLTQVEKEKGVVCASDGNLGQVVSFFCKYFKIHGTLSLFTKILKEPFMFQKSLSNGKFSSSRNTEASLSKSVS